MTDLTDIENYYKNLLIIQYHDKPKAQAVVSNWVDCMAGDGLLLQLYNAFNVDTTTGAQLDAIGRFLGVERFGLDDDLYRVLLNFKIVVDNGGSSMRDIDEILYEFFGRDIVCHNNQDMSLTYIIINNYSSLIPIIIANNFLPMPLGVEVRLIERVNLPDLIFGFKRGNITTQAVGFSDKSEAREAAFLSKDNIVTGA